MLGIIADDFTGATDIADALVQGGFKTTMCVGTPENDNAIAIADAVVIALKSRTSPVDIAITDTKRAFSWLKKHGATRFYFKYCSTFDSTAQGNIGPVIDCLAELTGARTIPVVPSYPANKRTVFQGYLFVGQQLLSESPMRHHPLTPMTDSNLVRLLKLQSRNHVELIALDILHQGKNSIRKACTSWKNTVTSIVVDAIDDNDLALIADSFSDQPLLTGGAALATHLAGPHPDDAREQAKRLSTLSVILVGSASDATRAQLSAAAQSGIQTLKLDVKLLATSFDEEIKRVFDWINDKTRKDKQTLLIIHSAEFANADKIAAERRDGYADAHHVEAAFATIAQKLFELGQRDFIVGGGETSGTVVEALKTHHLKIGQKIATGVVWGIGQTADGKNINLALKSGNFGGVDFFTAAWEKLK